MFPILWFILFLTVLIFHCHSEGAFVFIYYTMWTFSLEIVFFGLSFVKSMKNIRKHLFEIIFAPAIVVCFGFWIVIAPIYLQSSKPKNAVLVFVTHGCNAIAMLTEMKSISMSSVWKPVLYTIVYNLFLVVYVGSGGRSVSGKLPYWYTEYDKPIGWIFACLAVIAVFIVHVVSAAYIWPVRRHTTQYIV